MCTALSPNPPQCLPWRRSSQESFFKLRKVEITISAFTEWVRTMSNTPYSFALGPEKPRDMVVAVSSSLASLVYYTCNTTPTELTLELTQDSTHTGLTQFPLAGSFDFVTRPVETSAAQANRVAQLQALFGGALQGSVGAPATTATAAAQQTAADAAAAAAAAAATAGPRKTLAGCVCRKEWVPSEQSRSFSASAMDCRQCAAR